MNEEQESFEQRQFKQATILMKKLLENQKERKKVLKVNKVVQLPNRIISILNSSELKYLSCNRNKKIVLQYS